MASRIRPKADPQSPRATGFPQSDDPVVGHITQFLKHAAKYFSYYNLFLTNGDTLARLNKQRIVNPSVVTEMADCHREHCVQRAAALEVGRALAVELEGAAFDTTDLLRFLYTMDRGGGPEKAAPRWAELRVSLERFTIRRAIGKGERDGAATEPRPSRLKWLVKAMFMVKENPNLSNRKIAKAVERDPAQLTRSREYQRAAALARGSKQAVPRGSKNGLTGELEAEAEAREND